MEVNNTILGSKLLPPGSLYGVLFVGYCMAGVFRHSILEAEQGVGSDLDSCMCSYEPFYAFTC